MKHIEKAIDYKQLEVLSAAFNNDGIIPARYTCDGVNVHPPLTILNIPFPAECLAIIAECTDASENSKVHWLAWNIPVTHLLKENELHGIEGTNDFNENRYCGPCSPSGNQQYCFKIYALDALLNLPSNSRIHELEKAMSEHILGFGQLTGRY